MRILLIAGMPGAGKEEFLGVARSMGVPFLRMGDIVREYHASSGTDLTVGAFASAQREELGKDIWAKRALERMDGEVFLVDGCRSMDEVRSYRGLSDDVRIVGIYAPPSARYERLVRRGRDDAPRSPEEFEARDRREMGWGLADVLALADVMILNDSDLESFKVRTAITLEALL